MSSAECSDSFEENRCRSSVAMERQSNRETRPVRLRKDGIHLGSTDLCVHGK